MINKTVSIDDFSIDDPLTGKGCTGKIRFNEFHERWVERKVLNDREFALRYVVERLIIEATRDTLPRKRNVRSYDSELQGLDITNETVYNKNALLIDL